MPPNKKRGEAVDMLAAVAVDALKIAIPLAKAIPLVGNIVEGSLEAALYIVEIKDDIKTKKEKCKLLVDRVVTITAAVTTELMKTDRATLAQLESSAMAFSGTLSDIQTLLRELSSASLGHRIFKRGDDDARLVQLNQRLNTAIDTFKITKHMGAEAALAQLKVAVKEAEADREIFLLNTLLRPVMDASYRARTPTSGCLEGTRSSVLQDIATWSSDDITKVPRVFWLSGLGGTGKSTISHTICKTLLDNGQLGASFFFSRDMADRRQASSVIPTIAYQLAFVNAEYRRKLCLEGQS